MNTKIVSICVWLVFATKSFAVPIDIVNASFEDLYQGIDVLTGSFPTGDPPNGWVRYDLNGAPVSGSLVGVLNPGTQADYDLDGGNLSPCFPAGAPEGDNVALLFKSGGATADEYGIVQTLDAVLESNMRYTLSVDVGNIQTCSGLPAGFRTTFNLDGFPSYRIELRAGGELLVTDSGSLHPAEGEFQTAVLEFISDAGHPQLDQNLEIRLINLNIPDAGGLNLEVDFDDVTLNAVSHVSVPFFPIELAVTFAITLLLITHLSKKGDKFI